MVKVAAFSDFQSDLNGTSSSREFEKIAEQIPGAADVVVVAGDLHPSLFNSLKMLRDLSENVPVVYVPGNRDFYGCDLHDELERGRSYANVCQSEGRALHLLYNDAVNVGGVQFLGTTLWSDVEAFGQPTHVALHRMNDFRCIKHGGKAFNLDAYREEYHKAFAFLTSNLMGSRGEPVVCVTHTSPCVRSVPEAFKDDSSGMNSFFHSDTLARLPVEKMPDLWIHGGVHASMDYEFRGVRVVCNSLGYIHSLSPDRLHRENPTFDPSFVVNVG